MSTLNDRLMAAGVGVVHHFAGGLYAKETHIPAGTVLVQHEHAFDHLSALMLGTAVVEVGGIKAQWSAPALLTIRAGLPHSVTAVTDVIWACLHATNETDPAKVDEELIA
jgi:quercetin dioxygenase-like cupin family protein